MERVPSASMTHFAKPKDLISVLNMVFGFASIIAVHQGRLSLGALCLIGAAIADGLDGFIARRFSTPTAFGEAIDIADLVSFGAATGFFVTVWMGQTMLGHLAGTAIVMSSLLRLARFQVRDGDDFIGVPTTLNGVLYPFLFFSNPPTIAVAIVAFLVSFLNISSIRVQKAGDLL